MNHSEQIDQLAAALVAIQAEVPAIPKDANNPFFKSKYADLPAVVECASPIVTRHGVAVTQWPDFDGQHDLLTTMVVHTSGQWQSSTMRLHLPKQDPQGQGSALTYARRYAYMAALNLVADEDDDGNSASKSRRPQQQPARRQQTPGQVPAAEAKQRLLAAYQGDKGAAQQAWGDRGSVPIKEQELAELEDAAKVAVAFGADGAPFEEVAQ